MMSIPSIFKSLVKRLERTFRGRAAERDRTHDSNHTLNWCYAKIVEEKDDVNGHSQQRAETCSDVCGVVLVPCFWIENLVCDPGAT